MIRRIRRSSTAGYTFIEMITAFAVLSILTATVIMSMGPALRHGKVNNAANVVAGDLHYAQSLAVKHRRPIAVVVQTATKQYVIKDRDNPTVYLTRFLGPESEFSLDELTASPTSVELYPNGVVRATTTFTVGLDGYQRQVRLTRAGQIRIIRN